MHVSKFVISVNVQILSPLYPTEKKAEVIYRHLVLHDSLTVTVDTCSPIFRPYWRSQVPPLSGSKEEAGEAMFWGTVHDLHSMFHSCVQESSCIGEIINCWWHLRIFLNNVFCGIPDGAHPHPDSASSGPQVNGVWDPWNRALGNHRPAISRDKIILSIISIPLKKSWHTAPFK